MSKHLAAIHVLKAKLQLSDEDYRALLANLTGKTSAKALTEAQRARVRDHMQGLAVKLGVAQPRRRTGGSFYQSEEYQSATPMERKIHALWGALAASGAVHNGGRQALRAWVKRQTGVDDLRFCTPQQQHGLIESLKGWEGRA